MGRRDARPPLLNASALSMRPTVCSIRASAVTTVHPHGSRSHPSHPYQHPLGPPDPPESFPVGRQRVSPHVLRVVERESSSRQHGQEVQCRHPRQCDSSGLLPAHFIASPSVPGTDAQRGARYRRCRRHDVGFAVLLSGAGDEADAGLVLDRLEVLHGELDFTRGIRRDSPMSLHKSGRSPDDGFRERRRSAREAHRGKVRPRKRVRGRSVSPPRPRARPRPRRGGR